MSEPVLRLAVPAPLFQLFDYLPPEQLVSQNFRAGQRFLLPFGRIQVVGILIQVVAPTDADNTQLKRALALLDTEAIFPPKHLEFLAWAANYYHHPLGDALQTALPAVARQPKALPDLRIKAWRAIKPAPADQNLRRSPAQAQIYQVLLDSTLGLTAEQIQQRSGHPKPAPALKALHEKGLIEQIWQDIEPARAFPTDASLCLNPEQQSAVDTIASQLNHFGAFLLQGVTGSGKTEVYLQLASQVLELGRTVLLLVPEIGLTPQLLSRLQARLPERLAVLHSGMTDSERFAAWQQARNGKARIVVGTRSAILAPIAKLGLILVDEEHDSSYKQQEGFRYSARDLALVRAQRAHCPVVLGSATPSLESLHNAQLGRYQHFWLRQRAGDAHQPQVALVDIREQTLVGGLAPKLLSAIKQCLDSGQQAMLFLNRRGYAPVMSCISCGWLSNCPRCDARQTYHAAEHLLWCHHCGLQQPLPRACPSCGKATLQPLGQGTERLEQLLTELFPHTQLIRIDRDSTSRKGSLQDKLEAIHQGDPAILVGTQMLAKGHHFPNVTLVGMLDMDTGFFGVDFRAQERMAQLIIQVAGRAGRADKPGKVLIQTRFPEHPLLQTLLHQGYEGFAKAALSERKLAALPPFSYQALIRARAAKPERAEAFLAEVAQLVTNAKISVWGPAPAPMAKRAGQYHWHLLLQAERRADLQRALTQLLEQITKLPKSRSLKWSLDVDPADLF